MNYSVTEKRKEMKRKEKKTPAFVIMSPYDIIALSLICSFAAVFKRLRCGGWVGVFGYESVRLLEKVT